MARAAQTPAVSFNTIKAEATDTMKNQNAVSASFNAAKVSGSAARKTSRRKSLGQGMTEYIVIVALVAVAAIGVYTFLGNTIRAQTAGIAMEISGQSATKSIEAAKKAGKDAATEGGKPKTLNSYNNSTATN